MNKIIMLTDSHFGVYLKQGDKWKNMMVDYYNNVFLPYLIKNYKEGDIFIHGGDLYESRETIPIDIKYEAEKLIETIQNIMPVYILTGNHDMFYKSTSNNEISSIHNLSWLPNVTVIDKPKIINWKGIQLALLPYYNKTYDMIEAVKNNPADLCFTHSDLNGAVLHMNYKPRVNDHNIDISQFSGYKHVYSGHIHILQHQKNFSFIGSPYQLDRNDRGTKKGFQVIYDDYTTEHVENTYSPIFEKITIINEADMSKLENINTNNYIDLEVSTSLITNSRKIRKKLESILESSKFERVNYINDIVREPSLTEEKINKITENIDLVELKSNSHIEFDNIINNYIDYIEFDSEENKKGVLSELAVLKEKYKILNTPVNNM